jgi:Mn-dependent DtxR family transcriptional regulator
MILSRQSILARIERADLIIRPFFREKVVRSGKTFGLGGAGYDIRVKLDAEQVAISRGGFLLATTVEYMALPADLVGEVKDKSSWARLGLAVQNTTIEPGWRGYLTLELSYHGPAEWLSIADGALYRLNRRPLWLVLEEGDVFAPQQPMAEAARLLGEVDRIARRGRARGFRLISLTQRPAKINKDVLTQLSTLIALGISSPQDRAAIQAWIEGNADKSRAREVTDTLASLKVGEGWVWAPELELLERVTFPAIKTLDTSATPKAGENSAELGAKAAQAAGLLPDIARLKARLKSLTDEQESDVAEGNGKAADRITENATQSATQQQLAEAERRGYQRGLEASSERLRAEFDRGFEAGFRHALGEVTRACEKMLANPAPGFIIVPIAALPVPADMLAEAEAATTGGAGDQNRGTGSVVPAAIPPARQRILDALSWFSSIGLDAPERAALAFMAEATATSSGFQNNLGALRSAGLIDYPASGLVMLTEAGKKLARRPSRPRTNEALHEQIFDRLQPALRRILEAVIETYPDRISRIDLARDVGVSASSSGFQNNLGRLRSLGLIDYPASGFVVATKALFPIS